MHLSLSTVAAICLLATAACSGQEASNEIGDEHSDGSGGASPPGLCAPRAQQIITKHVAAWVASGVIPEVDEQPVRAMHEALRDAGFVTDPYRPMDYLITSQTRAMRDSCPLCDLTEMFEEMDFTGDHLVLVSAGQTNLTWLYYWADAGRATLDKAFFTDLSADKAVQCAADGKTRPVRWDGGR